MSSTKTKPLKHGLGRSVAFSLITAIFIMLFIELFSIVLVHFKYKKYNETLNKYSYSATLFIISNANNNFRSMTPYERSSVEPYPFFIEDELQGYKTKPGTYDLKFTKPTNKGLQSLHTKVTVLDNNQRFVGTPASGATKKVYIFGDSYVFGWGVNDEQTFTYLLQNAFPSYDFELYAAGSYSLTNAYINIQRIKEEINPDDIVLLFYGDYYKIRHVLAPSKLRENRGSSQFMKNPKIKGVKAELDASGNLTFDYIPMFCEFFEDYCNQPDPSDEYMDRVTVKLINGISELVSTKVAIFHIEGEKFSTILKNLNPSIDIVSATEDDFDRFIRDDIAGFDDHPGPFWHYEMYQLLSDYIKQIK